MPAMQPWGWVSASGSWSRASRVSSAALTWPCDGRILAPAPAALAGTRSGGRDEHPLQRTQWADASAETLFEVITDYINYPQFNSALIKVDVVKKDQDGAEFVADRKTKIGEQVHAWDRYERNGDFVVERTYEGVDGASTWTIHPVDEGHSTLTIDAAQSMGPVRGSVMRPFLKKIFYGINFTPFIEEPERREKAARA
jgi:ribosome-associated toxin RatA of RatAB toxin-antitoxin module